VIRSVQFVAVALLFVATPALAEVDFDEAVELAASNAEAPKAGDYPTTAVARFAMNAKDAVRRCVEDHDGGDPAALRIIVRLNSDGAIERVFQSEVTRAQGCVSSVVETQSFEPPPFAPFYLLLELGP